ncbi:hypothetical protein DPMN_042273 [Dreissena polymorpha]|uniref:Uncharacterized protein n=2 Tax=Dreissena polymorpha TaxID=45954 RepID=A0A9D4D1S9_DREPO|nr:hypothetical protein DPMN_042273 [Dreissena polymorpha]
MSENTDSEFDAKTNDTDDDDAFGDLRKEIHREPMEVQYAFDRQTSVDSDDASEGRRSKKGVKFELNGRNQTMPTMQYEVNSEHSNRSEEGPKIGSHENNEFTTNNEHEPLTTSILTKSSSADVNLMENNVKLPSVNKCQHMLHINGPDRDLILRKKFKQWDKPEGSCIICDIKDATAKYASVEANRILMEIVYPHRFYDKFQRSGKGKSQSGAVTRTPSFTKDAINICRQAKVSPKLGRRERTMPATYRSSGEASHTLSARESFRKWAADRLEQDYTAEKRSRREEKTRHGSQEAHLRCKEKTSAFVITDDSEGQKLVLKGLKGWLMKHYDNKRPKENKDVKKSMYLVGSLGIQFGIPEYNASLHDRKTTSPPPSACANSPRHVESHQPMKRPVTHIVSPRVQFHTNHNESRDIHSVPKRSIDGVSRTYASTFVPKLFEDKLNEEETKSNESDRDSVKLKNRYRKQNTSVTLPPISRDLRSKSLTFSLI